MIYDGVARSDGTRPLEGHRRFVIVVTYSIKSFSFSFHGTENTVFFSRWFCVLGYVSRMSHGDGAQPQPAVRFESPSKIVPHYIRMDRSTIRGMISCSVILGRFKSKVGGDPYIYIIRPFRNVFASLPLSPSR